MSFVQYSQPFHPGDLAFVGSYVLAPCFLQLFCVHVSSLKTQLPNFQKGSVTMEDISGGGMWAHPVFRIVRPPGPHGSLESHSWGIFLAFGKGHH